MSTSYLERPDGRIAYDVQGAGPLVVCVPGMGELRSSFRDIVTALTDAGLRVAAVDLRGHGDSDATFSSFDDEALASDIARHEQKLASDLVGDPPSLRDGVLPVGVSSTHHDQSRTAC